MNKVNFLAKEKFPLSSNTMDFVQQMVNLVSTTAALGGSNYIMYGCVDDGAGNISDGVVVIDGEMLPFEGGTKMAKIKIQETTKTLTAFGENYPEAYVYRVAKFDPAGDYDWNNFVQVQTNKELEMSIKSIKGEPVGVMYMWPGQISAIPENYRLCDGTELLIADYPEIFSILGTTYGGDGSTNFKLPDLRSRFVVGYDSAKNDYNNLGKTGGLDEVTLTIEQIPSHSHQYEQFATGSADLSRFSTTSNNDNETNTKPNTSATGGGEAHENRPPYFVLAYIIKVKP